MSEPIANGCFTTGFDCCEIYTLQVGLGRHSVLMRQPETFTKLIDPRSGTWKSIIDGSARTCEGSPLQPGHRGTQDLDLAVL